MNDVRAVDPRLTDLHRQVRAHFGAELTFLMAEVSRNEVRGVLYDAVVFQCGFDEPTGSFGASIQVGNDSAINRVFGEHIAQDRTPEAIARSLDLIHEYARLTLPEAYLERFAAAQLPGATG